MGSLTSTSREVTGLTLPATPERDKTHRFPTEIIRHGVWLSDRFSLRYRAVEERRGSVVKGERASSVRDFTSVNKARHEFLYIYIYLLYVSV